MNSFYLFSSIGFLISTWMGRFSYGLFILLVVSFYMIHRFKRVFIVCVWFVLSVCILGHVYCEQPVPKPGLYSIVEIKPKYCLASDKNSTILLYGVKNPSYHDVYRVHEIEEVHTNKNIGLFNFEQFLLKKGVRYASNVRFSDYRTSMSSIRNLVFSYFKKHSNASYYLSTLYGIHEDGIENMIISLGLPILFVSSSLRMFLRKFFKNSLSDLIVGIFLLGYGWFFVFTPSLIRILIFLFSSICFRKWEQGLSFSIYSFIFIMPGYRKDFIFIYPLLVRFIRYFCTDGIKRFVLSKICLFLSMLCYFHKLDILQFLFFGIFRKINACLLYISIPGLFCDDLFQTLYEMYQSCLLSIPKWIYVYVPDILFIFVFLILCFRIYCGKKCISYILILGSLLLFGQKLDPFFHVYMLDIGQGDCTVIVEPFQKSVVMIDCGQNLHRDNVKSIVLPFLETKHISSIDALIVTHDDFDHSGGVDALCKHIDVTKVIRSRQESVPVDYPFYSLIQERDAKDENDKSIVSYFSYDDITYLWMGDASTSIENEIIERYPNMQVHICKLGHHGSDTSSSYEFLNTYRFQCGFVSVGEKNRYKHPSMRVILDAHELGIDLLMTKDVGMVEVMSCKGLVLFRTATGLIGFL